MKNSRTISILIGAVVLSITAGFGGIAAPGAFDLRWNTIDGGGVTFSSGGGYELGGTIGQSDAGPATAMTGGAYQLVGGFWPGITPISSCISDIAPAGGNGIVNVDDLLMVINSWGPCAPGSCAADIVPAGPPQGNGVVNVDDLLAVINAWGACP